MALHAIEALSRGNAESIGKHRDRLLKFLDYDCTWIQTSAVCTLAKIAADPAHYKIVLPAILDRAATFRVDSASSRNMIQFMDGGKIAKSKYFGGYFWSCDKLIGINDEQALKFEVRTVGGRDFLIVERGGFNVTPESDDAVVIPKGWHCGYHVYVRP